MPAIERTWGGRWTTTPQRRHQESRRRVSITFCALLVGDISSPDPEDGSKNDEPPTPRTTSGHEQDLHRIVETSALLQSPKIDHLQSREKQRKELPGRGTFLFPQYHRNVFLPPKVSVFWRFHHLRSTRRAQGAKRDSQENQIRDAKNNRHQA